MCARNRLLPRVRLSMSARSPSSSSPRPATVRTSKKTQVSISAIGSGVSTHLRKYSAQTRRGWRHLSVMAIISPGQWI